jgi:hypothetical protein
MEAANTQPNRALAQAVNSRITADAVMLNAKSTVWRLIGVAKPPACRRPPAFGDAVEHRGSSGHGGRRRMA